MITGPLENYSRQRDLVLGEELFIPPHNIATYTGRGEYGDEAVFRYSQTPCPNRIGHVAKIIISDEVPLRGRLYSYRLGIARCNSPECDHPFPVTIDRNNRLRLLNTR